MSPPCTFGQGFYNHAERLRRWVIPTKTNKKTTIPLAERLIATAHALGVPVGILQAMNNAATEYEIVVGSVQGGRGTTRYFPYVQLKKDQSPALLPPMPFELFKTAGEALKAGREMFKDAATLQPEHIYRLSRLKNLIAEGRGLLDDGEPLDFIAEMLGDQIATWKAQCTKKKWTGVEITLVDDIYPILGIGEDEDNEDKPKTILRKADEKGESTPDAPEAPAEGDEGGDVLDVG